MPLIVYLPNLLPLHLSLRWLSQLRLHLSVRDRVTAGTDEAAAATAVTVKAFTFSAGNAVEVTALPFTAMAVAGSSVNDVAFWY